MKRRSVTARREGPGGQMTFEFRQWGVLSDGVLDMTVEAEEPADPVKGYVPCYRFKVARHGDPQKVGEVRLRVGSSQATPSLMTSGHIGYEINEDARGHGFAARACVLIGEVAVAHGLRPVLITCDPTNLASKRTCERIGAVLVGTYDVPPDHPMYLKGRRTVLRYEWRPS